MSVKHQITNSKWIFLLSIFILGIIQNCTTTEKVVTDNHNKDTLTTEDEEVYKEVRSLKTMLGHVAENSGSPDRAIEDQPLEFGLSVSDVQRQFPAPDKHEYEPMVNNKVTMLSRDLSGGRFTFFFYEDKLYKIIIISKWSNYSLQFAEDDITKTEKLFIEGNGEPDMMEEDEMHKKMVWLKNDVEVKLEEFNLMAHQGMNRVMSLMYTDRAISPLAKKDETFNLYKAKQREITDH